MRFAKKKFPTIHHNWVALIPEQDTEEFLAYDLRRQGKFPGAVMGTDSSNPLVEVYLKVSVVMLISEVRLLMSHHATYSERRFEFSRFNSPFENSSLCRNFAISRLTSHLLAFESIRLISISMANGGHTTGRRLRP